MRSPASLIWDADTGAINAFFAMCSGQLKRAEGSLMVLKALTSVSRQRVLLRQW